MGGANWEFDFSPELPVHVFPYTVYGSNDPLHWHKYYEIGLCTGKRGKFIYLEKVFEIGAGDIFLSNNNENHVAVADEGETVEFLFLIFLPSFISGPGGRALDRRYLSMFNYNALTFRNKIDADHIAAGRIAQLMWEAHEIYKKRDMFFELALDIKVRQILLELVSVYEKSDRNDTLNRINARVRTAVEYINEHYTEKITIGQMAAMVGMNASYFRHIFKENMQIPFKAYLTILRLAEARRLLLTTERGVHEIIADVGYTNVSQFYRIFREYSHMTPAEYRIYYKDAAELP
ncbi:MAG: AraC family transcriptional regulator [Clostridiales bacterium]|nr:AraC family transcriptional regulator [Clostridiales bacterium]